MNGKEISTEDPNNPPERKKEPEKNIEISQDDASSSKEMCAYCDTPTTVSSKFYNITNMGDLEYIGRRLNHLGPKKNPFCERVCKRHYDLNLKRDKAQRQYNAKRERLPGIDVILGLTKKQRTVPSSPTPHPPHPQSLPPTTTTTTEYPSPSPTQTSRIGIWYPTLTPILPGVGSHLETRSGILPQAQSQGQPQVTIPSVSNVPQFTSTTTTTSSPNQDPVYGFSYGNLQRGMKWVWETPNVPGTTTGSGELNVGSTLPTDPEERRNILLPKPDPLGNPRDPQVDEIPTVDLVASHMTNILSLFSTDSTEHTNFFKSIKQRALQQQDTPINVINVINALCSYTYNVISKIRQNEMNERQTQLQLRGSIRDLMELLLKREHREEVLLKGDNEIDALFMEWVDLQKSQAQ